MKKTWLKWKRAQAPVPEWQVQPPVQSQAPGKRDFLARHSLMYLLVTLLAVMAPHAQHLPMTIMALVALVVFWRWQMFRGLWRLPSQLVKLGIIVLSLLALIVGYGTRFSLEPMLGLFCLAFGLKLLEVRKKTDVFLMLMLGFFLTGCQFLLSQSLWQSLYGVLCLGLLLLCLISLQFRAPVLSFKRQCKVIALAVIPSLILAFGMLLVMPKLPSFWAVPNLSGNSMTGMSDAMSPGDLASLSQSTKPAFWVSFDNEKTPKKADFYWRGMSLDEFDGRTWRRSELNRGARGFEAVFEQAPKNSLNQPQWYDYSVLQEPSGQPWLFSLAGINSADPKAQISYRADGTIKRKKPVLERFRYRVSSSNKFRQDDGLDLDSPDNARWRQQMLALPKQGNNQTREQVALWRSQINSDRALIDHILGFYHQRFTYTLKPGVLGLNSVDEFLWQTQRGFCEHFSSSFVFMLRAAGIPARVMVGYQGGEYNPLENFYLVKQSDAHAWAEVWLEGRWQRFDPTAAVAPERVEGNLEQALSELDQELLQSPWQLGSYRHIAVLNNLAQRLDALNFRWQSMVNDYDVQAQQSLLQRWFGGVDWVTLGTVIGALVAGFILLMLVWLNWRDRPEPEDPATIQYRRFLSLMAVRGLPKDVGESPNAFALRANSQFPEQAVVITALTQAYIRVRYCGESDQLETLRRAILVLKSNFKVATRH